MSRCRLTSSQTSMSASSLHRKALPVRDSHPVFGEGSHAVAARVSKRLDDCPRGIERGQAGDTSLDGGAADAEAVLNLDTLAHLARAASDGVDDELYRPAAN